MFGLTANTKRKDDISNPFMLSKANNNVFSQKIEATCQPDRRKQLTKSKVRLLDTSPLFDLSNGCILA